MAWFKSFLQRRPRSWYWVAYAGAVAFFLLAIAQFYMPGKGFTSFILFGGKPEMRRIKELKTTTYYVEEDSYGYDAQYYAQVAVKPLLMSRDLQASMDNLPYRARRILFCWTAYLLGLGQPYLILQAYALQNVLAWLLLAWLLLRWFPPTSLGNLVRWGGTMFAWGLTMSVRSALMDGPSLLLIAWGVALAEQKHPWKSACVLGAAGLGRETNLLAASIHLPNRDWGWREVGLAAGRGLLVAAPLALWIAWLWWVFGQPSNAGQRNFAAPFEACLGKWHETVQSLRAHGWEFVPRWSLLMLVSLTVQFLAIVLRPRWDSLWWRIGAGYAVLLVFLGEAVWEGFPGAAARVVVPLTLAFNAVVPRGRWWWPVLLLGNLSAFSAFNQLRTPGHESFTLEGPKAVWMTPTHQSIDVAFTSGWYGVEQSPLEYWRWSRGSAEIVIQNPQPAPVEVEMDFDLRAYDERIVRVFQDKVLQWEGRVGRDSSEVRLRHVRLEPGPNPWRFETEGPPSTPNGDTLRPVAFNLRNLVIRAVRKLDKQAPSVSAAPP
ncbi:MAG TPA: hypothetical protein VLW52_11205 [Opitutaceae bacterium]|nr:hypothetical protein [Opitutaceae bacterium]